MVLEVILVVLRVVLVVLGLVLVVLGGSRLSFLMKLFLLRVGGCREILSTGSLPKALLGPNWQAMILSLML